MLTFECLFLLTAPARQGCGVGLEAAPVHVDGVEFGAEASNTVSAWFTRSVHNEASLPSFLMLNHPGLEDSQVLLDGYWVSDL